MSLPQWIPPYSVIGRLLREPYRFEFIQAIRLLDGWMGRHDSQRLTSRIRFRNRTTLGFAASEIEAIEHEEVANAHSSGEKFKTITVTPAILSLLGSTGELPYAASYRLMETQKIGRMESTHAFYDMLFQRSVELFYLARSSTRIFHNTAHNGQDLLLTRQLAIAGIIPVSSGCDEKCAIQTEVATRYATALQQHATSTVTLQTVLTAYFGLPIEVVQFVPDRYSLRDDERSHLGQKNRSVGKNLILGAHIPNFQRRIRLRIGPLKRDRYQQLLPDGSGLKTLEGLISCFQMGPLKLEVLLFLNREDACQVKLGKTRLSFGDHLSDRPRGPDYGAKRYQLSLT